MYTKQLEQPVESTFTAWNNNKKVANELRTVQFYKFIH